MKQITQISFTSAMLALAMPLSPCAFAQFATPPGLSIPQTPYNVLTTKVNLDGAAVFATDESRKNGAASMLADMDQLEPIIREQMKTQPQVLPYYRARLRAFAIYRLALNDPAALEAYNSAQATGGPAAVDASINRAAADWLDSGQDAAGQGAAFDELRKAIAASGQDETFMFWTDLLQYKNPVSDSVGTPLLAYLKRYSDAPGASLELPALERANRQMFLAGKPMTITGPLIAGEHFSTDQWNGKVIYIDLWAIWCAPCVAALPDIQAMYAAHHAQGLEVLGISCDESPEPLKAFLAKHPEITFPQLYDPLHHDFERDVSIRLGVQGLSIPMMIDRKGILHYWADPGETTEATVVRLLAEKP